LGHPRATQASRKGHPWVEWRKYLFLQQKLKKRPGGGAQIAAIADIARDRRDRKGKTSPQINTDSG
jgi:hypothetical protein